MATSEKRLYTYAELVGNFAKAFPSVAEKARHYQRLDEYGLFIVLKGGDKILYNGFDHSYINIPKDRSKMTNEDYKKDGISFVLYNNVWGTNFPLWYEDNACFQFEIKKK